jgi:hypothetical protein
VKQPHGTRPADSLKPGDTSVLSATKREILVASYRTVGAIAILVAISYQVITGLEHAGFSVTDYFSYFTVLSNLFAASMLLYGAWRVGKPRSERTELLRGASVLYMLTTGIVFAVLLSGKHVSIPWVNTIVHQVMPAVVALDWLVDPPHKPIELPRALWWLGFPLVYLIYTLIRGAIVNWYPYPFIDPRGHSGYLKVTGNCLGIAVGQILLIALITWTARQLGERGET